MNFIRLTESCYINRQDLDTAQHIAIEEYDYEMSNGEKVCGYEINLFFFEKDSLPILPITSKPEQLYEMIASISQKLDMVKLAPGLYINKTLKVKAFSIQEYCGDHPQRSEKHLILFMLSNGTHAAIGSFPNYQSALDYLSGVSCACHVSL